MPAPRLNRLETLFRWLLARRWWVIGVYGLLLFPSTYYSLRVPQDNSLDRLIVKSDPDYVTSHAFERVFGSAEYVLVLVETDDPFAPAVLARVDALERALAAVPNVEVSSALSVYRRAKAGFEPTPESATAFAKFARGTDLFRRQGLVLDRALGLALLLNVKTAPERHDVLARIDRILDQLEANPAPLKAVHKVGQPYVNRYLDEDTRSAGVRYFPLFGLFVVLLNLILYRSLRTLLAFVITLGVCVALTVGFIGLTGGVFTLVSALVPMTILVTCMATLLYLHSRFVERPATRSVDEHQIFALCNKFVACTASIIATAVGFAALSVSKIRPIREMGLWVAVGLAFTWITVFTLFPALQKTLKTPTERERKAAGQWFPRFTSWLPSFTYRFRWVFVPAALALCLIGGVALFGIPGWVQPMRLATSTLEYINRNTKLYQDTKYIEQSVSGLSLTEIWLKGKFGSVSDPDVIRGLNHFQTELEQQPQIGTVVGPISILRLFRYVTGKGDRLPDDRAELEQLGAQLETLLPQEPMLQRFIEPKNLDQTHMALITHNLTYDDYRALDQQIRQLWMKAVVRDPALKEFTVHTVGLGLLQAKISYYLVPTLTQSLGLTVAIIFGTFLLVFRNGAARVMAMIPSLFAILVMFAIMRATGMTLNIATILIAATVLGTSENDQIHFFYHFLEKRKEASTEASLRHTLQVAGRAIFFATLVNASGFLAFGLADLPPIRQFGILSALAFVLSMLADFTALPAALWMVFRERPDALKAAAGDPVDYLDPM